MAGALNLAVKMSCCRKVIGLPRRISDSRASFDCDCIRLFFLTLMAKLIIIVVSAHGVLHILFAKNFLASRSGGVASIVSRENLIALLALSSLQKI